MACFFALGFAVHHQGYGRVQSDDDQGEEGVGRQKPVDSLPGCLWAAFMEQRVVLRLRHDPALLEDLAGEGHGALEAGRP